MTPTRCGGQVQTPGLTAANTTPAADDTGWRRPQDLIDWWASPALAYWQGLQDGAAMQREHDAADDDAVHRAAVRNARRLIEVCERREAYDRGEVMP